METTADRRLLKLEGRLIGAWVEEANAAWRDFLTTHTHLPDVVNLCDVSTIDAAGRELLIRMSQRGVVFEARGCATRELLREIEEAAVHMVEHTEGRRA
jgi:hypothetical protein